jgi:hypothetical protein
MGHVERIIWWKGIETIDLWHYNQEISLNGNCITHNETFEIAILIVKRNENTTKTIFS